MVVLYGNFFTDPPMDVTDCIVNTGSCLRQTSSSINVFICGLIPRHESWSVNSVLIKDAYGILKHLCLKHDFAFIGQSNGSLFFRDSLHVIEDGNANLSKFIVDSIAPTNNIYFSSITDKRYSYSDTCKNKASVSFALTLIEADFPPLSPSIHAPKCKHSDFSNNCNRDLCETHDINYVSSTSKPAST